MPYQVTVLIWSFFSFDKVWAIQIFKFKKITSSNEILKHQIISAEKKWWIPKMYNSSRSTTFILVISSSDKVIVNIIHKSTCLSYSSWNYEWYVNLWTTFTNTLSNEEVTKIKVVDSDEFNNFYVHDFCSWNHLRFQNLVWSCHLLKFKIWAV